MQQINLLGTVRAGVVRVGEGFGIVVKVPTSRIVKGDSDLLPYIDPDQEGPPTYHVLTTACCLPPFPAQDDDLCGSDCMYRQLVGPLDQPYPIFRGENLYVDPVTDLTLLGPPSDDDGAFEGLGAAAVPLQVGPCNAPIEAWLMTPDTTRLIKGHAEPVAGALPWAGTGCLDLCNFGGMPLVDREGRAIGIVATSHGNTPNLNEHRYRESF